MRPNDFQCHDIEHCLVETLIIDKSFFSITFLHLRMLANLTINQFILNLGQCLHKILC